MPPLRTRMRKSRVATTSPYASMIKKIPSLSSALMLNTIVVRTATTLSPSPSLSLMLNVIETSTDLTTDIRNQTAITEALIRANHMLQSNRAANTKKAYNPKKKLWAAWCQRRKFADDETVTEEKLCLWLQKEVLINGNQGQGDQKGAMLSPQRVEGYIKPVIELYEVWNTLCFLLRKRILLTF